MKMALRAIAVCTVISRALAADITTREFEFKDDDGRVYSARLSLPDAPARTGVTVLLIGGGSAFDLHWTLPGSYSIDDVETRCTIDGKPTRDADRIAGELASAGFVVMQWGLIHRDDAKAKENPALAEGLPFPRSRELTRLALRELRWQPEVDGTRIVLIGYSLGATRACQIADDGVIGFVLLAGAYLSHTSTSPRAMATQAATKLGLGEAAHESVDREQYERLRADPAMGSQLTADFESVDRDGDGRARAWELAAAMQLHDDAAGVPGWRSDKMQFSGSEWPSQVLVKRRLPTLAISGGLDPISVHAPLLAREARGSGDTDWLTVLCLRDLGHMLSAERDGLCGPMSDAVIDAVRIWMVKHFGSRP
ncbi:MAG: dienelactone hydrolase family protein [Phycisphaerales bacterium]